MGRFQTVQLPIKITHALASHDTQHIIPPCAIPFCMYSVLMHQDVLCCRPCKDTVVLMPTYRQTNWTFHSSFSLWASRLSRAYGHSTMLSRILTVRSRLEQPTRCRLSRLQSTWPCFSIGLLSVVNSRITSCRSKPARTQHGLRPSKQAALGQMP